MKLVRTIAFNGFRPLDIVSANSDKVRWRCSYCNEFRSGIQISVICLVVVVPVLVLHRGLQLYAPALLVNAT